MYAVYSNICNKIQGFLKVDPTHVDASCHSLPVNPVGYIEYKNFWISGGCQFLVSCRNL